MSTAPEHHRSDAADRRAFLRCALLAGGVPLLALGCAGRPGAARARPTAETAPRTGEPPPPAPPVGPAETPDRPLPAPDFARHQILRFVSGVRPFRTGRVRIEAETLGAKLLVHNYGHGGAGLTLSWGSAGEVLRLVRERRNTPAGSRPAPVAVLGAGVIGLTAAHELLRAGHSVRVYARETLGGTTSWLAGGQWAPSLVARGHPPGDPGFFERLLKTSYARFVAQADLGGWGVFRRTNFVAGRAGSALRQIPADLVPPARPLERLPLAGVDAPGLAYATMLIEPPLFLPRLAREVESLGGRFERRAFVSMEEIGALHEPVVVNCLGLGARDVLDDPRLVPIRGQLVHLRPQDLPYLLSHDDGYIFPRHDAVVLGGSIERGSDNPVPDERACLEILERNERFFRRRPDRSVASRSPAR